MLLVWAAQFRFLLYVCFVYVASDILLNLKRFLAEQLIKWSGAFFLCCCVVATNKCLVLCKKKENLRLTSIWTSANEKKNRDWTIFNLREILWVHFHFTHCKRIKLPINSIDKKLNLLTDFAMKRQTIEYIGNRHYDRYKHKRIETILASL